MTFKGNNREFSTPLIEELSNEKLAELQNRFLEFTRNFEEIKEFAKSMGTYSRSEYLRRNNQIQVKINYLPDTMQQINTLMKELSGLSIKDESLKNRVREQLRVLNSRFIPQQNEVGKVLNEIVDKEKILIKRKDFMDATIQKTNSENSGNSISSDERQQQQKLNDNFILQEVVENQEYMNKRQIQLENIKKVTNQVKEISEQMGVKVQEDGKQLETVHDLIVDVNTNAKLAENEIIIAEKATRGSSKRLCCIAGIVIVIALVVVGIALLIHYTTK